MIWAEGRARIEVFNEDCMIGLKKMRDNEFDLAIIDPPFGLKISKKALGEMGGSYPVPKNYKKGNWDAEPPGPEFFKELFRVSKNQIIWGANHFISRIPFDSPCWIFWDKENGPCSYADGELAWTSFKRPVRRFRYKWRGFIKGKGDGLKERKIHPTQKPVALYKYLLKNFSKKGERILDTHLGSGSIAIACWDLGMDLVGFEIDKDYYEVAYKRFKEYTSQLKLPF